MKEKDNQKDLKNQEENYNLMNKLRKKKLKNMKKH